MKFSSRTGLFDGLYTTNLNSVARAVVVSSASIFSLFAVTGFAGIRINTTPSLPLGIYVETDAKSPLIEFCPSGQQAALAARRGYRASGDCPDGASPFLKPIVAKSGDTVELTAAGVSVNGRIIQNTAPLAVDTEHRPLEHFPYGRYVVGEREVWVASSYNKRSFDSRYYGPIPAFGIRAHLRPLITR